MLRGLALLVVVHGDGRAAAVDASLRLPSFLSDHMVLQRGGGVVWGWAAPGDVVHATVKGSDTVLASANATAAADGAWEVTLSVEAQLTSVVEVRTASASVLLEDVAWGDVFVCSGQSNMEYPMADAFNGTAERAASSYPTLRMLDLADRPWPVPSPSKNDTAHDCPSKAPYIWAASKPSTITPRSSSTTTRVGDGPTDFADKYPAAVCWFTARELVRAAPSVPIGIISASKSGSAIESWMPEAAILDGTPEVYGGNGSCGGTVPASAPQPPANGSASCPRNGLRKSGAYYRGMIAPLTPMRIKAVWWYQGEENDHSTDACPGPTWYRCLFPAMIAYWRREFKLPQLPFFYVLLAAGHTALLREAQYQGAGAINHTAFASAVDLGATGAEYLIPGHPPRKQEVGRRLALVNRALVYREPGVDYRGPRVIAHQVTVTTTTSRTSGGVASKGTHTTVRIPFLVGTQGHLHLNGTGGCTICCHGNSSFAEAGAHASNPSSPVALLDPDGRALYKTETFVVDAAAGVLTATIPGWQAPSSGVAEVRFLFDNFPQCALYSGVLSGPDAVYADVPHFGLVAESWRGNVTVNTGTIIV